jgi:hypothetical protein
MPKLTTDQKEYEYVKKLLQEEFKNVAMENRLGKTLVTGHKREFFEKAGIEMGLRLLSMLLSQSVAIDRIQKKLKS